MTIGLPELGVLGVLILLFLGKSFKKNSNKQESEKLTQKKQEIDMQANFQNINSDYDNTPIQKAPPPKGA